MIEIQTSAGYKAVAIYPKSVRITEMALTAEVVEDTGLPSFDALVQAWLAACPIMFRVDGEEVECRVQLSEPRLEPGKVMFRVMSLARLKTSEIGGITL